MSRPLAGLLLVVALVGGLLVGRWTAPASPDPRQPGSAESAGTREADTKGHGGSAPSAAHSRPAARTPGSEAAQRPAPARETAAGNGCPECTCPPAPECPACPVCATCPSTAVVCQTQSDTIGALQRELEETQKKLALAREGGPMGRYDAQTAQGRRRQAAQDGNLLLEFPSWGEELELPEERVAEFQLQPEEREHLEGLYRSFRESTLQELQEMYGELVGDPNAGADSTVNALLHNIMGLSNSDLCQERILAILSALSAGQPLVPPGPDAPACERAMYQVFLAVDSLEQEVSSSLGEEAAHALWSGSSSFTYSTEGSPEQK